MLSSFYLIGILIVLFGRLFTYFFVFSSVKINPSQDRFCFASDDSSKTIQVSINGTDPLTLTYLHKPFNSDSEDSKTYRVDLKDFSRSNIDDSEKGTVIGTFNLALKHPGRYTLLSVLDSQSRKFKIDRQFSSLVIPECPKAKFSDKSNTSIEDRCHSDSYSSTYPVLVSGIPPLKLTYSSQFDRENESDRILDYLIPNVPSESGNDTNDLNFQSPYSFSINIPAYSDSVGSYKYKIKKIEDGLGNIQTYNYFSDSDSSLLKTIKIHKTPKVVLKCSENKPVFVKHGDKGYSKKDVKLDISGEYPFVIKYGLRNSNSKDDTTWDHTFTKTINNEDESFIQVDQPGVYGLISVKDKFCSNEYVEPETCSILESKKPSAKLTFEPIESACSGTSGVKFDILFSGEPSFTIHYKETITPFDKSKSKTVLDRSIEVDSLNYELPIEPSIPGHYHFKFYRVDDINYKGIPLNQEFTQEIHPTPDLKIINNQDKRTCTNETTSIPIHLSGSKPFNIKYIVKSPSKVTQYSGKFSNDGNNNLNIDMEQPGKYIVQFTSIEDSRKCKVSGLKKMLNIEVASSRPSAQFNCMGRDNHGSLAYGHIFSREGAKGVLPIKFQGQPPFTMTYTFESSISEKAEEITLKNINQVEYELVVKEPGTYTIDSVADQYCGNSNFSGKGANMCEFGHYPKPSVKLQTADKSTKLQPVCQNQPSFFELEFDGMSPYSLEYSVLKSSTQSDDFKVVGRAKIDTYNHKYKVDTWVKDAGHYNYKFNKVTDYYYKDSDLESVLSVEQVVYPHPEASFIKPSPSMLLKETDNRQCVNTLLGDPSNPIQVRLKGSPSFDLSAKLSHQHGVTENLQFFNISENTFSLTHPKKLTNPGLYTLDLTNVADDNQCEHTPSENNKLKIQVDPIAKLNAHVSPSSHYCVGDFMSFSLAGTPPWYVTYTLNGQQEVLNDLRTSTLKKPAEREGVLEINKVCNVQKDHCCTDYSNEQNSLKYYIHPIPSAIMSEGKVVQRHIHDGDSETIKIKLVGSKILYYHI